MPKGTHLSRVAMNWVEQTGGLPPYIKRIKTRLMESNPSWTEGHAIAVAVNVVKRMCATGDLNFVGVQHVNPKARAEACNAVREWERKKAQAHAD